MPALKTDGDVISKLLYQRQLQEFARNKKPFHEELDVPKDVDPVKATEWVFTEDFTFAGGFSGGTIRYIRGEHISYAPMIRQLREAKAPMLPVR